ncbi:MAG: hypothetical protein KDD53_12180, partial [Bdellovibrionales bacterium]|nr:hypothetical protein [Bdellovibrionales bacterium]
MTEWCGVLAIGNCLREALEYRNGVLEDIVSPIDTLLALTDARDGTETTQIGIGVAATTTLEQAILSGLNSAARRFTLDDIHSILGTEERFTRFVKACKTHGLTETLEKISELGDDNSPFVVDRWLAKNFPRDVTAPE